MNGSRIEAIVSASDSISVKKACGLRQPCIRHYCIRTRCNLSTPISNFQSSVGPTVCSTSLASLLASLCCLFPVLPPHIIDSFLPFVLTPHHLLPEVTLRDVYANNRTNMSHWDLDWGTET